MVAAKKTVAYREFVASPECLKGLQLNRRRSDEPKRERLVHWQIPMVTMLMQSAEVQYECDADKLGAEDHANNEILFAFGGLLHRCNL